MVEEWLERRLKDEEHLDLARKHKSRACWRDATGHGGRRRRRIVGRVEC